MDFPRKIVTLVGDHDVDPFIEVGDNVQMLKPELADLLNVPRDAVCIRSRHVWTSGNMEVLLEHESFDPVPEGAPYPRHK